MQIAAGLRVTDADALATWLTDIVTEGAGRNDAIFLRTAYEASVQENDDALAEELLAAGRRADDTARRRPMGEDDEKQLQSNHADVAHVGGGFTAWRDEGGPVDVPEGARLSGTVTDRDTGEVLDEATVVLLRPDFSTHAVRDLDAGTVLNRAAGQEQAAGDDVDGGRIVDRIGGVHRVVGQRRANPIEGHDRHAGRGLCLGVPGSGYSGCRQPAGRGTVGPDARCGL